MKTAAIKSSSLVTLLLSLGVLSTHALPIITGVVETGGDDSVNTRAQFTGETFNHPNLGANYTVQTFREDVGVYRDRAHQWNGPALDIPIPEYLLGGEYIMIRNDNRDNANFKLVVTTSARADVYLLIDNRVANGAGTPPSFETAMQWVVEQEWQPVLNGFNRLFDPSIPDEIGVDEVGTAGVGPGDNIQNFSSVYHKQIAAGSFELYQQNAGGINMYGVVVKAIAGSPENPPSILNLSPTNSAIFASAASGLTFTASTVSPNSIAPTGITLTLNGVDVSSQLAMGGTAISRTATFSSLLPNRIYHARIEARDQAGRTTSEELTFDTFDASSSVVIEAEDYNYDSGKFLSTPAVGAYAGFVGIPDVDYADGNATVPAAEYRPEDFTTISAGTDVARPAFVAAGATDYVVGQFRAGDWMNYTRSFAADRYHVYLRAGSSSPQPVALSLVTAGSATTSQTVSSLGTFQAPGTAFGYVPLTDAAGNAVTVALSGAQTLRLTGLPSANPTIVLNFLLLVPADNTTQAPYVASISPSSNATDVPLAATVNATIVGGSAPLDTASVKLFFNSADVTSAATITPSGGGAQIAYDPPGSLAVGASFPVRLVFSDNAGGLITNEWSFRTLQFTRIITSAVDSGGDDDVNTPVQYTGQTFVHPNLGTITVPSFQEDAPAYRDRAHQWNGATAALPLPGYLVGAEYIMTRNDNRDNFPYQIDVTVSQPALVFVLVDNRLGLTDNNGGNPPENGLPLAEWELMNWLGTEGFSPVSTGHNRAGNSAAPDEVGLDEAGDGTGAGAGINQYASIYVKEVPAGTFALYQSDTAGRNMYGVVVKPVAAHDFAPVVSLTSPTNLQAFPTMPASITLSANATVRSSTISRVEFLQGTNVLGLDSSAPFTFNWSNVAPGRYFVRARATAANGQTTTSAAVQFTVGNVIGVNFQDFTAETPEGYLPDFGDIFGDRGNGQSYGWDDDNTLHARNRNSALSLDERHDTFNHMQKLDPLPAGSLWEILLPNGRYRVTAVAGDATAFDSVFDLQAEGMTLLSATPTTDRRFVEGTAIVTVSDGRLSIGNGPTAANNKIAFIDIVALGNELPAPQLNTPTITGGNITVTWSGGTLESATALGPQTVWTPIGSSGTHTEPLGSGRMKFFRVRQ